ncbi:sensor histidine kinase [Microlunatus endophyticus]
MIALGLQPTTIRVDQPHGDHLPQRIVEVVGEILDEALLNAAQHAPGAELMIKVLRDATAIRVEVINGRRTADTGPTCGSGQGVPALAHRIAEIGGMFLVGPAAGGFAVRALLPLDQVARPGGQVGTAGALSDRGPGG